MEIFFLCLGFVALPLVAWGVAELFRAYLLPPKSTEAVLKKKDTVKTENDSGKKRVRYRLTFLTDERTLTFFVSYGEFAVARANTRGTLTYRGRRFLSFK